MAKENKREKIAKKMVMGGSMTARHLGGVLKEFKNNPRLTGYSVVNHGKVERAEGHLGQRDESPGAKRVSEGRRK